MSLKSEFIFRLSFAAVVVDDHFPGGLHPCPGVVRLPELDVEGTVMVFELGHVGHDDARRCLYFHGWLPC